MSLFLTVVFLFYFLKKAMRYLTAEAIFSLSTNQIEELLNSLYSCYNFLSVDRGFLSSLQMGGFLLMFRLHV